MQWASTVAINPHSPAESSRRHTHLPCSTARCDMATKEPQSNEQDELVEVAPGVVSDEADDSSERPADPVDLENDGETQLAGEDQNH